MPPGWASRGVKLSASLVVGGDVMGGGTVILSRITQNQSKYRLEWEKMVQGGALTRGFLSSSAGSSMGPSLCLNWPPNLSINSRRADTCTLSSFPGRPERRAGPTFVTSSSLAESCAANDQQGFLELNKARMLQW